MALYACAVVVACCALLVGIGIGMALSDREWAEHGDMKHGRIVRGSRAFLVVDMDDSEACNAAREQIEDMQDRTLRAF